MDKPNVVYIHGGVSLSLTKETRTQAPAQMGLEDITLREMSQLQRRQILHGSTYMRSREQSTQRQKVEWWAQGWVEGSSEFVFKGDSVSGEMGEFCRWMRVMVAHSCECAQGRCPVHSETGTVLHFMPRISYHNKNQNKHLVLTICTGDTQSEV